MKLTQGVVEQEMQKLETLTGDLKTGLDTVNDLTITRDTGLRNELDAMTCLLYTSDAADE